MVEDGEPPFCITIDFYLKFKKIIILVPKFKFGGADVIINRCESHIFKTNKKYLATLFSTRMDESTLSTRQIFYFNI